MSEQSEGDLLLDAARRGIHYRETMNERRVSPTAEAVAAVDRFREPLPEIGLPADNTLALLDEVGSPATVTMRQESSSPLIMR